MKPIPSTPERPETVDIGGIEFTDPYRWLAEDTPETLQWQREQDARAEAALADSGQVARFEALLEPAFADMYNFHAPQPVAGRWFHRTTLPGAALPVVQISDEADGPRRTLFELAQLDCPTALLHHIVPSPDATQLIVVAALNDAAHRLSILVIDCASGALLHRIDEHGHIFAPVWLPGNSGFLASGHLATPLPEGLPPAPGMRVFEQSFADGYPRRFLPLSHQHSVVVVAASEDRRHLIISESQVSIHPTWIRPFDGRSDADWQPFLDASFGRVRGVIHGQDYIAIHRDDEVPTGQLVAIPLASPRDRRSWRVLRAAGTDTLASVSRVGERLVLGVFHEGFSRLEVLTLDGAFERHIALPADGAVGKFALGFIASIIDDLVWSDGQRRLSFVFSSPRHAPLAYCYDMDDERLQALGGARGQVLTQTSLQTLEARAEDGARVVYHVLRRDDAQGPGPTIVTGYGGFNAPWLACWSALGAAWVEAGGTWVHTHLRGGGEFGQAFWKGGRMANKPNTFEDLYAVLRDLAARGISTVEQLGIFGTSNGGGLVCAAVAHRPDLFAAGVAQVPVTDVHDVVRDPMPHSICAADYGNPLVPEEAQWLARWSPYRTLQRGARYPALLLDSSANDTTCPPWHGRKFAAFLQNHGAEGSGPVLLRVRADAGHNEMTRPLFIRRDAEELAFMAQALGLAG